jgi:hypothetical protein
MSEELKKALDNMIGLSTDTLKELKSKTDETLRDLENKVEEFTDQTSDRLANILDPARIQEETAFKALKKLQKKREAWKPFDYGLGDISQIVAILSGSQPSPELLPLESLQHPSESNLEPIMQPQSNNPLSTSKTEEMEVVNAEVISSELESQSIVPTTQKPVESLTVPVERKKTRYSSKRQENG